MSAPSHVPARLQRPKAYQSPPRRAGSWRANRPGEVIGAPQPAGPALGNQGPDQGYVLKLARSVVDDLVLAPGEHAEDAIAGAAAVALRRASIHGRGPTLEDLKIALTLFGYLSEAPAELVELRRELFDEVHLWTVHYFDGRAIADSVPEATLRMSLPEVEAAVAADWRAALGR